MSARDRILNAHDSQSLTDSALFVREDSVNFWRARGRFRFVSAVCVREVAVCVGVNSMSSMLLVRRV